MFLHILWHGESGNTNISVSPSVKSVDEFYTVNGLSNPVYGVKFVNWWDPLAYWFRDIIHQS